MIAFPTTLERKLLDAGARPSAFDYMRLSLACSIVLWHTVKINYGEAAELAVWNGPLRPLLGAILPMFFALSGFLVAGSYERCATVASFMFLRLIRIFPALVTETALSALLIGPLFTSLSLQDYFSAKAFYSYLLNMIGDVHYHLPGVFLDNPTPATVNGQLWTVPYELKCYILVLLLSVFGLAQNTKMLCGALVALQLVMFQRAYVYGEVGAAAPGNVLILCFLGGFILFRLRNSVPHDWRLLVLAVLLHLALYGVKYGDYAIAIPDAYITAYLGLLNPRRIFVIKGGDISYGIYLYGFVIQQAVAALGPWTHEWAISLALSAPIILVVATASWTLLEIRFLRLKVFAAKIDQAVHSSRSMRFLFRLRAAGMRR